MSHLVGKTALVTGGSRGIGAAIAIRLAEDGANVAITFNSSAEKADSVVARIKSLGRQAMAIRADMADAQSVRAAIQETHAAFGRLDILVNPAGVASFAPLDGYAIEAFDETFDVNVRGVFVAAQAASSVMGEGGRIINIGSVNADRIPFAGGAVYAASKAALVGLTKGLSRDLGPRSITINNIQPGPVDTDMNPSNGPFADALRGMMAIPKYGEGADIAALVSFIAAPSTGYMTGASLTMDGGFAA